MNYSDYKNLYFAGPAEGIQKAFENFGNPKHTVSVASESSNDLKTEIAKLMRSDLLITCEDWENRFQSVKLVEVARIALIEVVHVINFQNVINQ